MALFIGQALYAQFSISGTITDQQNQIPLGGASVRITSASNPGFSRNILSDTSGRFSFQDLTSDSFVLSVSFVGFKNLTRGIRLDSTSIDPDTAGVRNVNIGVALVSTSSSDLAAVVISTRIPPATQKADTLQINASQYKVNPDASTEDLVKKNAGYYH